MSHDNHLPTPYKPNEEERLNYYIGLSGSPLLIARTSSTPWIWPSFYLWQPRKSRSTIRDHGILLKYTDDIVRSIIAVLEDFPWKRFYPIRFVDDYHIKGTSPPVLVIQTEFEHIEWEIALAAAMKCRSILHSTGLSDVEVEIQYTNETPFAITKELDELIKSTQWSHDNRYLHNDMLPFSSHPGYAINNSSRTGEGTMGLYLQLGDSDAFYGLTCRHVALNNQVLDSTDFTKDNIQSIQQINQNRFLEEHESLGETASLFKKEYEILEEKIQHWDNWYSTDDEFSKTKVACKPTDEDRADVPKLKSKAELAKRMADHVEYLENHDRVIGHVAHAPAYGNTDAEYWRDWALIELDLSRAFSGDPTNRIYVGFAEAEIITMSKELRHLKRQYPRLIHNLNTDGFIQLRKDIVAIPDPGNRKSLPVGKRGMASGLTFGLTNEILAIRRHPLPGRTSLVWEWLVLGIDKKFFSQPGDSGAAVWDFEGRFLGMLTGGTTRENAKAFDNPPYSHEDPEMPAGTNESALSQQMPQAIEGTDISFVTPAEVLFEDIRSFTSKAPCIV